MKRIHSVIYIEMKKNVYTCIRNKEHSQFFMDSRFSQNKFNTNTNIYVVDGEGLKVAVLRCNV